MKNKRKCTIERYDETITKEPYLTYQIDTVYVDEPLEDNGGVQFAENLRIACREKGYHFRFYTSTKDKLIDYTIVVV